MGTATASERHEEPVLLPDCAVVFVPQGGSQRGAECLRAAGDDDRRDHDGQREHDRGGHDRRDHDYDYDDNDGYGHHGGHSGHGHGHHNDDNHGHHGRSSYVVVTEHGPWGSRAQRNGWHLYFVEPGLYYMPRRFNDEASAWAAFGFCGRFHVNAPGTQPSAVFRANRAGNFPHGAVGNDELSGVSVYQHCA